MEGKVIKVLFIGQPNVGKSSIFNMVTKSHVEVGNWPGKTVAVNKGEVSFKGYKLVLYDLPGIYGFTTLTQEELVAREAILLEKPDVVVVVVDSTIPERTMNLAIQVLELTGRVVLVFSKTDLAHGRGIHINYEGIARELNVPVVPVSIVSGFEVERLLDEIINVAEGRKGRREPLRIDYNGLNEYVDSLEEMLSRSGRLKEYPARWVAVRLLEGDSVLEEIVKSTLSSDEFKRVEELLGEARRLIGVPAERITEARFKLINAIASKHIVKVKVKPRGPSPSIFYKPVVSILIALGIYLSIFMLVFTLNTGFPLNTILSAMGFENAASIVEEYSLSGLVEKSFTALTSMLEPMSHVNPALYSFIVDGVIGGVASILVFLPLIIVMVIVQVIVEDSGLAPRLAVASHSFFAKMGLSGHAFFPFMLGFGCNVPAVLATRTNPNSVERLRLLLTLSFIPCQARLVVLLAFTSAVSRLFSGLILLSSYLLAVAVFLIVNYVLYKLSRSDAKEPQLLMEVPAFHRPLARVVYWKTLATVKHFAKRAGLVIFAGSMFIWFITSFTTSLTYTGNIDESIASIASRGLQFITAPLGITGGNAWIIALSIITGFIAKELVVSTLLVATGSDTVRGAMSVLGLSDLQLFSLAVFTTLYMPCLATVATIYSESRSVKTTLTAVAISLVAAYIVAAAAGSIASLLISG